jgi:hypothetical protein
LTDTAAALGLFRGPDLIVVSVNEELERLTGKPCVGYPAREVWFDAEARTAQALMALVLSDGVTRQHPSLDWEGQPGQVVVQRVEVEGHRYVATAFRRLPVRSDAPTPSLPVQAPLLVR